MKTKTRIIAAVLMAALLCLTAACSQGNKPDEESFMAYVDANTPDEVLSRHQNFLADYTSSLGEEFDSSGVYFLDGDRCYWDDNNENQYLTERDRFWGRYQDDEEQYYYVYLSDSKEMYEEWFEDETIDNYFLAIQTDGLVRTIDEGDGKFVGVIEIDDEDYVKDTITGSGLDDAIEYTEGMVVSYRYTFSTETKDMTEREAKLTNADGQEVVSNLTVYSFDVDKDYPFTREGAFGDYRDALNDPERNRTVTVVYEPDTPNERSVDFVIPHHVPIVVYCGGEYVEKIYTDRECTQLLQGGDGVSDTVLYVAGAEIE